MIRKFFRIIAYCHRIRKSVIPLTIIRSLAAASLPFVSLHYAGKIVTDLSIGAGFDAVWPSILLLSLLCLGLGLIQIVCDHILNTEHELLNFRLGTLICQKCISLPYDVLESKEAKEMLARAEGGENSSGGIIYFVQEAIGSVLEGIVSIVYAFILMADCFTSIESLNDEPIFLFLNNPWSTLIVFALIILSVTLSFLAGRRFNKAMKEFFETNVEGNRRGSIIGGMGSSNELAKDVRIYGYQDLFLHISEEEFANEAAFFKKFSHKEAGYSIINFLAGFIPLAGAYFFVGAKAYYGIIAIGSIITVVGAISTLTGALNKLIEAFINLRLMTDYLSYYFDFLDLPDGKKDGKPLPEGDYVLRFEDVSFTYSNTEVPALDGVSFEIAPHRKTAIVGPNGAGKSTIIKLASRLYRPTSGRITLNGVDINELDGEQYNRLLAILFQDFSLFAFTVGENVGSSFDYDREKAASCLTQAGFDMSCAPEGLDTVVLADSVEGKDFSGGERQKIAIARALYKDSPFILLDEPTSALDPKSELEVYDSIAHLVGGKTSLFISHRMSSTKFCDEIIVIDKGKVVQQGSHESLMKEEGLYATLFNEQAKYYL